ncbi:MAG: Zn-ribbon domain-containing OB-fold protein [Dehalococcoidia bacterium]
MPGPIDYSLLKVQPDPDTAEWWDATKERRFLVRQCNRCRYRYFPPYPACPHCNSMDLGWHESEGKGLIYSYTVVVHPILAPFVDAVPYVVAVIELPDCANSDGSVTRVVGVLMDDEDKVAIGQPVEVVFEESPEAGYVMPRWRVQGTAQDTWKFQG